MSQISILGGGGGGSGGVSYVTGTAQTIDAVTADIITFSMGTTRGTRLAEIKIIGTCEEVKFFYSGCCYNVICGVRTDGSASFLVGTPEKFVVEDASLTNCDVNCFIVGNSLVIRVLGAAGKTIDWKATLQYIGV